MRSRIETRAEPAHPGIGPGRDWRFWAILALFGLLLALHLAAPRLDSDQAVTGLMGAYILRGEFPIFFWGQHHAGVPESYGAAVTFFLFGLSRLTLGLVPALAALGLLLLVYRTGAVLFGHGAGLLAMVFATIVSPYAVAHYVRARAYYVEHLLLGQILLLGAALWLARPREEPARGRVLVAMGLAGGVGLYCGFQIVAALLPAALAVVLVEPRLPLRRGAWLGLGAFLVGSAPFWIYNLTHQWTTFATGARFQGRQSAGEAARIVFADLLPVVLGMQEYIGTPPYLPAPAGLAIPVVAGAAVTLLAVRVARGVARLRRDPALAGEALLLTALIVTVGAVWYGRFVQVPRYLIAVPPVLALILARACQLTWRRVPAVALVGAAAYLVTVGVPLVGDVTVLWPASRAAYRQARANDAALFAFLHARGLDRAYTYEYWLGPRLTFDGWAAGNARRSTIVAEPFNDRYPPHARAVDASPRPAYVVRTDPDRFESWFHAIGARAERAEVGPYTVFWSFAAPPPAVPLPRSGWVARTSHGVGAPESVLDARLDTGWSSARDRADAAWIEVDLGHPRRIAGVTLVTDHARRLPQALTVATADGPTPGPVLARIATGGFTVAWRNGAPRTVPGRTLTVRFPPVEARRLRMTDAEPAGTWAVAELFLLAPAGGAGARAPDSGPLADGRHLEAAGQLGRALLSYRDAMRAAPDDPEGYAEFVRLSNEVRLRAGTPAEQAARYAELGLFDEARAVYAQLAAQLGPEWTHAELSERQARLASESDDGAAARRLEAEARAARSPRHPVGAVFGRVVELAGYDVMPQAVRPGESIHLTYHWRLLAPPGAPLAAYVHVRSESRAAPRFGDDHPLPAPIGGLGGGPQHVSERREVGVPPDVEPGRYRIVVGVWEPGSASHLHRWWHGLLPTLRTTVELGTLDVTPR